MGDQWAAAARDLVLLRAKVIDDVDDDGAPVARLVIPKQGLPADRHMPAEMVSARNIRRVLGGPSYLPVHPADLFWRDHIPAPKYEPMRVRQQWRWVHNAVRSPALRLVHFNVIHGAFPVLARLQHTDPYLRVHAPGNPALTLCPLCASTRETVYHLFYECPVAKRLHQQFISIICHLVPTLHVGAQDVASLILTKLDSLLQAHRAPDHTRLALNVTQAVMLQAVWEARNDSRDRNAPADLDRVSRHFGVSLRCCLRSIGRSLPHVMDAWIQAPALFRPCRGVLYFE